MLGRCCTAAGFKRQVIHCFCAWAYAMPQNVPINITDVVAVTTPIMHVVGINEHMQDNMNYGVHA